jgi:hypothetical protein
MRSSRSALNNICLCAVVALLGCGDGSDTHGAPLEVGQTQQSACKPGSMGGAGSFLGGQAAITAQVSSGVVTITHKDAHYNCASKLMLQVTVSGSTITVREVITNPKEMAFCMCDYDLSVQVAGLPAGSYAVEVHDADGKLVGSVPVTI